MYEALAFGLYLSSDMGTYPDSVLVAGLLQRIQLSYLTSTGLMRLCYLPQVSTMCLLFWARTRRS